MATRDSSRKRPSGRREAGRPRDTPSPDVDQSAEGRTRPARSIEEEQQIPELDLLDEILGRFSDALALVETAHCALDHAQDESPMISPGVLTLYRGIEDLKGVYTEFDLTLVHLRRRGGTS